MAEYVTQQQQIKARGRNEIVLDKFMHYVDDQAYPLHP
jgi:hypothetical protein